MWRPGLGLLVVVLLMMVPASQVTAQAPTTAPQPLTPLLKALDLRGYPSPTVPPKFAGSTFDAHEVSLAKLQGQVVIVNFWASWCAECRPEMPVLERLHRERAGRGLVVIGINVREGMPTVRRYARELDLTFPLVLDTTGAINSLYGVVGLPTTFVIDRDGRAVALAVGPREWESAPARALFDALLREPARQRGMP